MKAKLTIAFVIVFCLGIYLGAMSIRLQEYARGGEHSLQAKALLKEINDYKSNHGQYPDHDWFEALGDRRITTEGRIWTYYNPPKQESKGRQLLISAPIDRGKMYMNGFTDGAVAGTRVDKKQQ